MPKVKKEKRGAFRYDSNRVRLRTGESQVKTGSYMYRWTDRNGKRHAVYAATLDALREKEEQIIVDRHDGIRVDRTGVTINDMYDLWVSIKRGVRESTMTSYMYAYEHHVKETFGKKRLYTVKKSDVRRFYNTLYDTRGLSIYTVENIHTVLHQVLQMAVDDNMIRVNPASGALNELKAEHGNGKNHRTALTVAQQKMFLDYMLHHQKYRHWYPIFYIMINTGMRVGEAVVLRHQDVDMEKGLISVNHNLVYFNRIRDGEGCHYGMNPVKTHAGIRVIPMTEGVKQAFLMEKEYQDLVGNHNTDSVEGYTDFIFANGNGHLLNFEYLNRALHRIVRDCNDEQIEKHGLDRALLLPEITCHILRHTFATRMVESGMNIKMIQSILGHADITTTMNIYVTVTEDMREKEMNVLEAYLEKM